MCNRFGRRSKRSMQNTIRTNSSIPTREISFSSVDLARAKRPWAKVMEDIFHLSTERNLYSETKQIEFYKVTTGPPDGKRYFFNIIDMPGFFDMSTDPKQSVTNGQVKSFIINCISKNVCNIHVFAYAFSLSGGINEQDIESMVLTKTILSQSLIEYGSGDHRL